MIFHPRGADFEVVSLPAPPPMLREGSGRSVDEVLDRAIGIDFG